MKGILIILGLMAIFAAAGFLATDRVVNNRQLAKAKETEGPMPPADEPLKQALYLNRQFARAASDMQTRTKYAYIGGVAGGCVGATVGICIVAYLDRRRKAKRTGEFVDS